MKRAKFRNLSVSMLLSLALLLTAGVCTGKPVTAAAETSSSASASKTGALANGSVNLVYDAAQKTAVMSNGYYTIKFNDSGRGYSMTDSTGKEMMGKTHGLSLGKNGHENFKPTSLKIVTNSSAMADIAYCSDWGEIHYVMCSGVSGFYSYFVVSNEDHSLDNVAEFRTDYWFNGDIFRNGYNSQRSGPFPTLQDISAGTKLQDETWRLKDGSPYTKYDWADYQANDFVHV